MKKIMSLLLCLSLLPGIAAFAAGAEDTNYMEIMIQAAMEGDREKGEAAAQARNEKIDALGLDYVKIDFTELLLLSKIIYAEAGSVWLDENWKMAVGEVVLNRVESPEFPNTMIEVLEQPGQYYGKDNPYFNSILPSEACIIAAMKLLEGQRVLADPSVVFQSNYILGSGIHTQLYDEQLGYTYFCFSSRPELYEG